MTDKKKSFSQDESNEKLMLLASVSVIDRIDELKSLLKRDSPKGFAKGVIFLGLFAEQVKKALIDERINLPEIVGHFFRNESTFSEVCITKNRKMIRLSRPAPGFLQASNPAQYHFFINKDRKSVSGNGEEVSLNKSFQIALAMIAEISCPDFFKE